MIGNDIIDLSKARRESNWQRNGFMNKIFTHQERKFILSQKDEETMVWVLWSIKEAVYKTAYQINGKREFAPTKIICSDICLSGKKINTEVSYHLNTYRVQTYISGNYIHSIATSSLSFIDKVISKIIIDYPSDYIAYLQENNLLPSHCTILKKESGVPYLFNNQTKKTRPLSISHHGIFLGITYFNE